MRALLRLFVVAVVLFPLTARAIDVWGDQWGTWTRDNSPYNVIGEIRVPPESTLVIEPGVVVKFQGHYKFIVDSLATLLAVGTEIDSIFFTCDTLANPDRWHGIRFVCADSNSQISYCRLEYGRATGEGEDRRGGAIYCGGSSPMIRNNIITHNAALAGGGVFCEFASRPVISNNAISGNSADWGGGIYCSDNSSPTITNNIIKGNSATSGDGGGIYCWASSPTISNNTISGNSAGNLGGGIVCLFDCNPTISGNSISGNSAGNYGGGAFCIESSPTISNNLISGNSARFGGGICCLLNSSATITNTILWADTAPDGPEILGDPTVTYCDVQGGWPGEGNIDADPMFVGPHNDDFHLRWHSPCIDAGDPDPIYNDPDGTRNDMGAFYFNQDLPGIVEGYPYNTPIVIPPEGGDLTYDGWVFNFSNWELTVDIWVYVFVPEIGQYGPMNFYENITISPGDSTGTEYLKHVPGGAPAGEYTIVGYIGDYPHGIIDSAYFYFSKTGSIGGGVADWFQGSQWLKESDLAEPNLPAHYALSQNYPNPFNATTVINYQLPVDAYVRLDIYNLLGERVAKLVDGKQQAGYRSVLWNALEVSSGLYFYKLTAGDFAETKRMMLVK